MRGHQAATEERRKEEDQAFLREQRGQQREQWGRDKEERDRLAAVLPVGEHEDPNAVLGWNYAERPEGPPKIKVTPEDYALGLSRAYKYSPDKALAAVTAADAFKEKAYQEHKRNVVDAALRAQSLFDAGDHRGAMAHLQSVYRTINDGKELVNETGGDGIERWGVAQAGRYLSEPQPMSPELVKQAVWSALKFATPEMFKTVGTLENQGITARAAQTTAAAATKKADTDEGYRRFLEGRPIVGQDGTGRMVVLSPDGTRQIGTFGAARPQTGTGGLNSLIDPAAYKAAVTRYNELAAQFEAETDPAKRRKLRQDLNVVASQLATASGRPRQVSDGAPEKPSITFEKFMEQFGGQPSSAIDRATGKPIPLNRLPPGQALQEYNAFLNSNAPASGGVPEIGAPARGGQPAPTAPAAPSVAPAPAAQTVPIEQEIAGIQERLLRDSEQGFSFSGLLRGQSVAQQLQSGRTFGNRLSPAERATLESRLRILEERAAERRRLHAEAQGEIGLPPRVR